MNNPFFLHVNNHANVKSERTLSTQLSKMDILKGVKVKVVDVNRKPSFTFAGMLVGNEFHIGISKCHENDQFVKAVGRDKALGRARSKNKLVVVVPDYVLKENKTGRFFSDLCKQMLTHVE